MKILVTGCAGFIGAACAQKLLARGDEVIGIDNLNNYCDVLLKQARLKLLEAYENFNFCRGDIVNFEFLSKITRDEKPQKILHLAAQVGVRHSLEAPQAYIESNLVGFANILEIAWHHHVDNLVFASSSSVYGANTKMPYATTDNVDRPISLYAATKKSNELMAHSSEDQICAVRPRPAQSSKRKPPASMRPGVWDRFLAVTKFACIWTRK